MSETHPIATLPGLRLFTALLVGSGSLCHKCGFGTKATSKNWARCKRCGARVPRKDMDEVGETLRVRLTPQDWRDDRELEES